MRTFLETTHERYEKAVGDQFGITVHGMFSDEVGLLSPIPWSKLLPEEFEKRNGYSLLDCMPALHDDSFENAMKSDMTCMKQLIFFSGRAIINRFLTGVGSIIYNMLRKCLPCDTVHNVTVIS